jgi:hypothetical protein
MCQFSDYEMILTGLGLVAPALIAAEVHRWHKPRQSRNDS